MAVTLARVFSYIRFSSRKQLDGDSLRRQVSIGDQWIQKNGHSLAPIKLRDLGKSGFHGAHLGKTGALTKFLGMIKSGSVAANDILLIENLDRLDRRGIRQAQDVFKEILDAGVLIAVMTPYEKIYDRKALDDPFTLLEPLMAFHLAFIESQKKSDRQKSLWDQKRKDALQGVKLNTRAPGWLEYKNGQFVTNEGAKAIQFLFEKTAMGVGQRRLLQMLVDSFVPLGHSRTWNTSFIQKVLCDRSVLGCLQPKTKENGQRIPIGPEIPDYYPAIITNDVWQRAQSARNNNKRHKGPSSKFVNLFSGLVICAVDGHKMHVQTTKRKTGIQKRFISYGHHLKIPDTCPFSISYPEFEHNLLLNLSELRPEDFKSQSEASELRKLQQALDGITQRLKRLETDLVEASEDQYETLKNAVTLATARKKELTIEISKLECMAYSDQSLGSIQSINKMLETIKGNELQETRFRLRSLLAEIIESIYVKPEKHLGRIYVLVQVHYKNGTLRQFGFGPGWITTKSEKLSVCSELTFTFDLRDRNKCQEEHLSDLVKLIHDPSPSPAYKKIPVFLEGAGELFLSVKKSELRSESFKTIPSKIRRFVKFTGEKSKTSDVSAKDFQLYTTHLIQQYTAGKCTRSLARVEINRVKEFLLWLMDGKATKHFLLNDSAAKLLP
jgi:DNA invertase Pin-like site-specific DNA recombinase